MIKGFFMLDDLLLFVMLVENNYSFSKVSELAQIQQSTVSKRITKLESKLNRRLLIRDTRNSTITSYGLFIYEKYRHLNSPLYNIFDQDIANDNSESNHESLNVFLPTVLSYKLICPYLDDFVDKFPNVGLSIEVGYEKPDFGDGLDLAVTPFYFDHSDFVCRYLRQEVSVLYCTPEYGKKYGIPHDISELRNHRIIELTSSTNCYNLSELEKIKLINTNTSEEFILVNHNVKLKVNSTLHMKAIAQNSHNYIFGSWKHFCQSEVDSGKLIRVLPDWEVYPLNFYLVSRKNVRPI